MHEGGGVGEGSTLDVFAEHRLLRSHSRDLAPSDAHHVVHVMLERLLETEDCLIRAISQENLILARLVELYKRRRVVWAFLCLLPDVRSQIAVRRSSGRRVARERALSATRHAAMVDDAFPLLLPLAVMRASFAAQLVRLKREEAVDQRVLLESGQTARRRNG